MKKTIMVIVPSMVGGGAERVLSVLMNNLVKKEYRVVLVLVKKNAVIEYKLDSNIIIERNQKESGNKLIKILSEILFIRKNMKKYDKVNCISFIDTYNLYTIIASIGLKINVTVSERRDPKRSFTKHIRLLNTVRNILYKKANHVVFQTKEARDYFSNLKDAVIIPNPLEVNLPNKESYADDKIFVAVGRLEAQKNYKMLLDAVNLVCESFPEVKLKIYGKGTLEKELKDYCNTLKFGQRIFFEGFSTEIHSKLLKAYAYVSSSDYEGISNAMLEALAIGVPCICTDCPVGGARESIEDHVSGLLVPIQDAKAMAAAMVELLEYPDKREEYGNKAKEIKHRLNVEIIVKKWEELFI